MSATAQCLLGREALPSAATPAVLVLEGCDRRACRGDLSRSLLRMGFRSIYGVAHSCFEPMS
jgi:hypothetical protein